MQADIKDALCGKYGAECNFPSWTKPFLHAVGIMNKLTDIGEEIRDESHVGDADTATEASEAGEEGDSDAESDDGESLLSVSCIVSLRNVDANIMEKQSSKATGKEVQNVQDLVREAEQNLLSVSLS
jgi:hypothetical protein